MGALQAVAKPARLVDRPEDAVIVVQLTNPSPVSSVSVRVAAGMKPSGIVSVTSYVATSPIATAGIRRVTFGRCR